MKSRSMQFLRLVALMVVGASIVIGCTSKKSDNDQEIAQLQKRLDSIMGQYEKLKSQDKGSNDVLAAKDSTIQAQADEIQRLLMRMRQLQQDPDQEQVIVDNSAEVKQYQKELREKEAQLKSLRSQLDRQTKELASLQERLQKNANAGNAAADAKLQAKVDKLQSNIKTQETKIKDLNGQITKLNKRIDDLVRQNQELSARNGSLGTENGTLASKNRELNQRVTAMQKQIDQLKAQATAKPKPTQAEIEAAATAVIGKNTEEMEGYKRKITKLEGEAKQLRGQIATMQTTIDNLRQQAQPVAEADATAQVKELQERMASMQSRTAELEQQVATLTLTIAERDAQIADQTAQIAERDVRIAQLQASEGQAANQQQLVAEAAQQVAEAAQNAATAAQQAATEAEQDAAVVTEIASSQLMEQIAQLQQQVADQQQQIAQMSGDLQAKETELAATKEDLKAAKEAAGKSSSQAAEIMKSKGSANQKLTELQALCDSYAAEIERLRAENEQLRTENEHLRNEAETSQQNSAVIANENERLLQKVALASVLVTSDMTITPAKSVSGVTVKPTEKASNIQAVKIDCKILDNNVVDPGTITIYARISTANNRIVSNGNSNDTFDMGGVPMQYTVKQDIEFTGLSRKVSMIWRKLESVEMSAGLYWVTLYANGNEIGKTSFTLK